METRQLDAIALEGNLVVWQRQRLHARNVLGGKLRRQGKRAGNPEEKYRFHLSEDDEEGRLSSRQTFRKR